VIGHGPDELVNVGNQKQLFADDWLVQSAYKVQRVYHSPLKLGANPVLGREADGRFPHCSLGTVLLDEGLFRMWYSAGRFRGPRQLRAMGIAYACSDDGVTWSRPELGLCEYAGSRRNNLLMAAELPGAVYGPSVMLAGPILTVGSHYAMVYYQTRLPNASRGVAVAFSDDGIRWDPHVSSPVWQTPADHVAEDLGMGTGDDVVTCVFDPSKGRYVAHRRIMSDEFAVYRPGLDDAYRPDLDDFLRVQARAESEDLLAWLGHQVTLAPTLQDACDTEYYGFTPFLYESLYLGFLTAYHTDDLTLDVYLRQSRDGIDWQRAGVLPFIPRGKEGAFDHQMVWFPCSPIEWGDQLLIYYGGCDYPHSLEDERWGDAAIGLARLRLDGFVSLFSNKPNACIVTKAFQCAHGELVLNADSRRGSLSVEVLSEEGHPITGYTRAGCKVDLSTHPYHSSLGQTEGGDSVRGFVSWADDRRLSDLAGRAIRLRIYLQNCHLYALQISDSASPS